VLVAFSIQGFNDLPLAIMGVSAVLILGVINMYNFMDGVNGMSLIYAFVFFLSVVFLYRFSPSYGSDSVLVYVILLIVISCFWFNIRLRALAFLGDAGSIFLGLLISYFVCNLIIVSGSISYLLLISVYAVDSVGTIILRLLKKQNIFDAHRLHVYQMLANEYEWGHLKVASFYGILQVVINGLYIMLFPESDVYFIIILILLTIGYLILRVNVFHDFSFTKTTQD
jgi:UDP-N-acetylmuramyl pentapeptide phosphotransferase/UDP-N-acetylglucosamine-1-phosphate transferase